MNGQNNLRAAVQANGFAMKEAQLFLNTHPADAGALAYFEQKAALYRRAVEQYEERFGPLCAERGVKDGRWAWGTEPWPWEGGGSDVDV